MRSEIRRARELRRNMSEPEVILWSRLKRLRSDGYAFRRQYPFRGYFLDFVCLSYRLAVEVDGSQHTEERQARVTAGDVHRHLNDVMDHIIAILDASPRVGGSRSSDAPSLDLTASH